MLVPSWENAAWFWGWAWWGISGGWPVLVAFPGLIAFYWQWRDRKTKQESEIPYIRIEDGSAVGLIGPWRPIRILVRNDSRTPIDVRSISVRRPFILARLNGKNQPDLRSAGQSLHLSLRVGASSGKNDTYAFVGSTDRSMSQVQLSMRAQYSEHSASRRDRTIKIRSETIDVPHITINKSS